MAAAAPTITVKRVTQKYVNSKVKWANKPTTTATNQATNSHASTGDNDLWEFDVTAMMQSIANGTAWYGFHVSSNSTTTRQFWAADGTGNKPELEVTWSEAPDAPTTMNPSGGQHVSIAKPVSKATTPTSPGRPPSPTCKSI